MSRGKRPKGASFDLNIALYMADNYMRTADRAVKELPPEGVSERQTTSAGPLYLAISSLSFSLEIYFKAIVFAAQERTLEGHDLERLWGALPEAAQTWLSQNFDRNYVPTGRDWSIHLRWSPFLTGTSHEADVRTPGLSALDMVKGHCLVFTVARYGYELPAASRLDLILYNVPGLQRVKPKVS
jgi:hypothetical protein